MEELFEKRRKGKEEPCVRLFLAKKMTLGDPFSIDVRAPSTKCMEIPFRMWKRSQNSGSEMSLVGFFRQVRSTPAPIRTSFWPTNHTDRSNVPPC